MLLVAGYAAGVWSDRSGGRVRVSELLDRPVPMLGAAAVLLVVALFLAPHRPGRGLFTAPVVLVTGILVLRVLIGALDTAEPPRQHTVLTVAAPGRADRLLSVVRHAVGPCWSVEVETGAGWSARRWLLGVFEHGPAAGGPVDGRWDGPDRVVVRAADGEHVFDLPDDPGERPHRR
ncbi:hypothetical protein BX265_1124 [Streptomyces sp. TLI_235]|nr:hypothetical protein [Streptomyces sp. TLI_235]PBC76408.1 hypothetical protein BX265_1124 [Streptomyces sp. TLI_235]